MVLVWPSPIPFHAIDPIGFWRVHVVIAARPAAIPTAPRSAKTLLAYVIALRRRLDGLEACSGRWVLAPQSDGQQVWRLLLLLLLESQRLGSSPRNQPPGQFWLFASRPCSGDDSICAHSNIPGTRVNNLEARTSTLPWLALDPAR